MSSLQPRRLRQAILAAMLGIASALLVLLLVGIWLLRGDAAMLDAATLEAAQLRWAAAGPSSYELVIRVGGRRAGEVRLTVEDGQVTSMTRDGQVPAQRRTWDIWAVPGLFEMLEWELSADERQAAADQVPPQQVAGNRRITWAKFDPKYGYPANFQRQVLGSPEDNLEWEVLEFRELPVR